MSTINFTATVTDNVKIEGVTLYIDAIEKVNQFCYSESQMIGVVVGLVVFLILGFCLGIKFAKRGDK